MTANLRARLLRGGAGSLAIKLGSVGLQFAVTVELARTLGPDGYGVYALVLAIVTVLAVPTQLGLPQLVIRETARAQADAQWGRLRGLWRWSALVVWASSGAVALLGLAAIWTFQAHISRTILYTLIAGFALVPLIALGNLRGAALRGLRHVVAGLLPEQILRPGLLLLLLFAAVALLPSQPVTPLVAMALHALAAALAFAIGAALLALLRPRPLAHRPQLEYPLVFIALVLYPIQPLTPAELILHILAFAAGATLIYILRQRPRTQPPQPEYAMRSWWVSIVPLALTAGVGVINAQADILVLGLFRPADDVGVYKVAVQAATLIPFGLQAVNLVIMPYIARLHAAGDHRRLQRLVTQSARAILALALPLVLAFVFFGDAILAFAFGPEYARGHNALILMSLGQLVNTGMGSVGVLLNMTGHERDTLRVVAIAAVANVALNFVLIPPFGLVGAATATACTFIMWNLLLRRAVWRRIHIETMAFAMRRA
jgi:O-antigen/teichoic acid export membrane protein